MIFYRVFYTNNTWDNVVTNKEIQNPKQVCSTCCQVKRISMFRYILDKLNIFLPQYFKIVGEEKK